MNEYSEDCTSPGASVEVKAYAKINLDFRILDKLDNGYHTIESTFQAVDLYDTLEISKRTKGYSLTGSIMCEPAQNLITMAHESLENSLMRELPCNIHLTKNIPICAGLGGGSSDAAATLAGLNELFSLGLHSEQLVKIAAGVGSDVPYFTAGHGTAHVTGKGEIVKKKETGKSDFFLLARPHKRISTVMMYETHDKTGKEFFEIAAEICPVTKDIYKHFNPISNECGMSGSGPTMFAGFDTCNEALQAARDFGIDTFDGDLFLCRPVDNTYALRQ